jgi:hypothetical protein
MKAFASCASVAFMSALVSCTSSPAAANTNIYDNTSVSSQGLDRAADDGPLYNSFSTGAAAVDLALVFVNLSNDGVTGSAGGVFQRQFIRRQLDQPGRFTDNDRNARRQ